MPSRPDPERSAAKPAFGQDYLDWLDTSWEGDTRELREGRFLHQQADLRQAFEASAYWREVGSRLAPWARRFEERTDAQLFQGQPSLPSLHSKPWSSFLSRTWRENVNNNRNWPDPPAGGWWLPDNWLERAWDVIRTRFVVRYLDARQALAEDLVKCAQDKRFRLEAELEERATESGYYALHVRIQQSFSTPALYYEGMVGRRSGIEIQVTTELAEVISHLTHAHYEARRESTERRGSGQWNYYSDEFTSTFLGHELFALEGRVMALRQSMREGSPDGRR